MIQNIEELYAQLMDEFPQTNPQLQKFPSGAAMLDFTAQGETYVLEYLPSLSKFGLSKKSTATFGWEGVDTAFDVFAEVRSHVLQLVSK